MYTTQDYFDDDEYITYRCIYLRGGLVAASSFWPRLALNSFIFANSSSLEAALTTTSVLGRRATLPKAIGNWIDLKRGEFGGC